MKYIIIGSGFAGYSLARELRQFDQQTDLLILTEDNGDFYSKPLLSKALSEKRSIDILAMKSAQQLSEELNAEVLTKTTAMKIDTATQTIDYQQGDDQPPLTVKQCKYDKLILACGAQPILPPIEGNAVNDILHVNNLEDYEKFQQKIGTDKHVALIGAGLIGCEFANDLSNTGYPVDVISLDHWPLPKLLPQNLGNLLQQALEKNGVQFHMNQSVQSVNNSNQQYDIELRNQTTIRADVVLSAIGLLPNIELAKQAGLNTNQGIITDQYLQTSDANIYAIGDCAEVCGLIRQHIAPIRHAANVLAKTLSGQTTKVNYPAMAIGVKTPSYPVVVCPPLQQPQGEWQVDIDDGNNGKALHYDSNKQINGFILTGKKVIERAALEKQLAPWL